MGHGQKENNNDLESKESDNDEEDDDPLNEFIAAVKYETCLQSIAPALPPHTKVSALCLDLLEPT